VLRYLTVACLVLAGCSVSRTHIGIHNLGQGPYWHSVVGKKNVDSLRDLEDAWMALVSKRDLETLSEDFAPKLASKMNEKVREKLAVQIERDYHPNGFFRRRRFETPALSTGRAVRGDAFEWYDMVGFAYQMEGKVEAGVQFYITKIDGELKICGIEIRPTMEAEREKAKDVLFVFPESENKAGIKPQPGMLMKPTPR
jgi:hypothetical protein